MFPGTSWRDKFWACFELLVLHLLNQDFTSFCVVSLFSWAFFMGFSSPWSHGCAAEKSSEASPGCVWCSFPSAAQSHSELQLLHRGWFSHLSRRNSSSRSWRELKCQMSNWGCPGRFVSLALQTCWVCLSQN